MTKRELTLLMAANILRTGPTFIHSHDPMMRYRQAIDEASLLQRLYDEAGGALPAPPAPWPFPPRPS